MRIRAAGWTDLSKVIDVEELEIIGPWARWIVSCYRQVLVAPRSCLASYFPRGAMKSAPQIGSNRNCNRLLYMLHADISWLRDIKAGLEGEPPSKEAKVEAGTEKHWVRTSCLAASRPSKGSQQMFKDPLSSFGSSSS